MANTRGGNGQRTTGVAAAVCARHEVLPPLGVAPLRKGERYETMDWVLCGALSFVRAAAVTISYDVACQYAINLPARLAGIRPASVIWAGAQAFAKFYETGLITYVVPKFHLYAHKAYCQLRYALGWLFGSAITDGEAPERVWSALNAAVSSLREMGPGGYHDTMDDMFGAWNWLKTCCIGSSLCERMERALDEGDKQTETHTAFDEALRASHPEQVSREQARIATWQASDNTKLPDADCPYYAESKGKAIAQIRLETEQAKGGATCEGAHFESVEEAELADCILDGMKIEDERQRLASNHADDNDDDGTIDQRTTRTRSLNNLARMIMKFRSAQENTMPLIFAALSPDDREPDRRTAMTVPLCLPSAPPLNKPSAVSSTDKAVESTLRWEAMKDELDNLLHHLRLKGCMHKHRIAGPTGQRAGTRALTAQISVNDNIRRASNAYRRHREAYFALVGGGDWEKIMRKLEDADCRCLGDRLIEQMEKMTEENVQAFLDGKYEAVHSGETEYTLPWIWYNRAESSGDIIGELMSEYAKSHARSQHWVHEVRLVDTEMQRVLDFNESIARIWDSRRVVGETIDVGDERIWASDDGWEDGMRAYASKQAFIRRAQAEKWREEFAGLRKEAKWFLKVHTEEGISLDAETLLPADEVVEYRQGVAERRARRTKKRKTRRKQQAADAAAAEAARGESDPDSLAGNSDVDGDGDDSSPFTFNGNAVGKGGRKARANAGTPSAHAQRGGRGGRSGRGKGRGRGRGARGGAK
ncbi:unnamed protein product [Peniophora sp. CBMAI 1063]|nr:unnamed protein product [Peniophora sp. CBMAI 1063]